ncbi:MAG: hypothetical protein ACRDWI_19605 [Jiangellaceae bacterium]
MGGTLMARRGRPTVEITVTAEERATLERWCRRRKTAAGLAMRSRIVLTAFLREGTE